MRNIGVRDWVGGVFIAMSLIALGEFCVYLNHIFYLRYGPFWDSVSYDSLLARVMLTARAGGVFQGMSLMANSTVALPWIESALLAPFVEPSRAIGVWIQISWMIVTALAGYIYFRRVAGYNAITAVCCTLIFFSIASIFWFDGGVSDFKLDCFQYILFGLACFLYLIASADGRLWIWALWGAAVGLTCLGRGTTPIYAVLVFGPFLLVDLWQQRQALRAVIVRYSIGLLTCVYVCGWFYLSNLAHLYIYYFVWHYSIQGIYPLSESKRHFVNVYNQIGPAAAIACSAMFALNVGPRLFGTVLGKWNLRPLWCGIAPLGCLILTGAEPVVSLSQIAVFGFVLFLLAPIISPVERPPTQRRTIVAVLALLLTVVAGVGIGLRDHTGDTDRPGLATVPPRSAITEIIRCMTDDMSSDASSTLTFATLFTGALNNDVIMNSLIFDAYPPAELLSDGALAVRVHRNVLTMSPARIDRLTAPIQWATLSGADDQEKINLLAQDISAQTDYVIVPSKQSTLSRFTINKYAGQISDKVVGLTSLRPLCMDIAITQSETVSVYRNDSRDHGAGAGAQ
jgi:hypothetical protein